jgi:DNA invertase Pin-like site-specific DNA recombinase
LADPPPARLGNAVGTIVNIIYARFSSELQRTDSINDQVRRCRDHLQRNGIDPTSFQIIADEAISGTLDSRPGFDQIKDLVYSIGILISTELSRVSRGDNAKAFLNDIDVGLRELKALQVSCQSSSARRKSPTASRRRR